MKSNQQRCAPLCASTLPRVCTPADSSSRGDSSLRPPTVTVSMGHAVHNGKFFAFNRRCPGRGEPRDGPHAPGRHHRDDGAVCGACCRALAARRSIAQHERRCLDRGAQGAKCLGVCDQGTVQSVLLATESLLSRESAKCLQFCAQDCVHRALQACASEMSIMPSEPG